MPSQCSLFRFSALGGISVHSLSSQCTSRHLMGSTQIYYLIKHLELQAHLKSALVSLGSTTLVAMHSLFLIEKLMNRFNEWYQFTHALWWIFINHHQMVPDNLHMPTLTFCGWQFYFEELRSIDTCQCNNYGRLLQLTAQHGVIALHQRLSYIFGFGCMQIGRNGLLNLKEDDVLHVHSLKCRSTMVSVYLLMCNSNRNSPQLWQ